MANIKKEIYYLLDFKTKEIFVYDNFIDARKKEKFFKEKYGARTLILPNGNKIEDCNPINYKTKKLKYYYGTVYCLYKFKDNGTFHAYWEGRKKEIDAIKKYNDTKDWKLKKFVLQSYNNFCKKHGFGDN